MSQPGQAAVLPSGRAGSCRLTKMPISDQSRAARRSGGRTVSNGAPAQSIEELDHHLADVKSDIQGHDCSRRVKLGLPLCLTERIQKCRFFLLNGNRHAPASYALELSRSCDDACAAGAGKGGRVGSVTRSAVDRSRGRSRGSGSHSTLSVSHHAPYRTHGHARRPDVK